MKVARSIFFDENTLAAYPIQQQRRHHPGRIRALATVVLRLKPPLDLSSRSRSVTRSRTTYAGDPAAGWAPTLAFA
jgi:hypothetical protein